MAIGTEAIPVDGRTQSPAINPTGKTPVKTNQKQAAKPASVGSSPGSSPHWLGTHEGRILACLLLLVIIAGSGWRLFRPSEVMVAPVVRQEITSEVEGTGTVTTRVLANVGSKINGRIEKMLVEEGNLVTAGQIVATLEDTDLRRQVDTARAELEVARASALEAKRTWARTEKLVATFVVSHEDGDVAEAH